MQSANPEGHEAERGWAFLVLVPAILLTFLVGPIAKVHDSALLHGLLHSFLMLCIFGGIWAYSPRPRAVRLGAVLLLANWACRLLTAAAEPESRLVRYLVDDTSGAPLVVLSLIVQVGFLLQARRVTPSHLASAVFTYVLLGLLWSYAYIVTWLADEGAFALPKADVGTQQFIYFSFVTMTTLGYGDMAPRSGFAQGLAVLQALVGQVFLAVFVAHLVSLNILRATSDDPRR